MIERLETIYGTMFVPSTDTGQYHWLKNTGASPEDEMIEMVCAILDARPKGVALDCGANFGCWSLALSKHATRVDAFEPQPGVHGLLVRTIDANGLRDRIIPLWVALGEARGATVIPKLDIEKDTNFGGISLGMPHSEHPDAPLLTVDIHAIDEIMLDKSERVSFIKADVEGSELALFKGAQDTIRRWKPIIIAECDHPKTDTQALGSFIESLGYNVEIAQDNNFIGMPV